MQGWRGKSSFCSNSCWSPFQLSPLGQRGVPERGATLSQPCAPLLSPSPWNLRLQSLGNLSFPPQPGCGSGGCRGQQQTPLSQELMLAKPGQACRGFGWGGRSALFWVMAEGQFGCPWGTGAQDRTGTECLLLGLHRDGAMVLVMEMSFPEGGWELLAQGLRLLQLLPRQTNGADGAQGAQGGDRGTGRAARTPRDAKGHQGTRLPSSCCSGAGLGGGSRSPRGCRCLNSGRGTDFLLPAVIGCSICALTLLLFNLALPGAAACSQRWIFYLRASCFGGKDRTSLVC